MSNMSKLRLMLVLSVLALAIAVFGVSTMAAPQAGAPELSGVWKLNVDASTIPQPSQNTAQMISRAGSHVTCHTIVGNSRHCQANSASTKLANNT